ncbi:MULTISPECIES: DUF6732 family protein [unclassified Dinoroseobacter]|uniref:DUF6732 family protein n=1 Tax=unclassified Dinoroseobacter TaxID=2620028 RepID=UPI003C7E5EE5
MTRLCLRFLTACLALGTGPLWAHPGHLSGLAGHDHWVAGAAIGLAIALGIYGALKGRKSDGQTQEAESDEAAEDDKAEAPA